MHLIARNIQKSRGFVCNVYAVMTLLFIAIGTEAFALSPPSGKDGQPRAIATTAEALQVSECVVDATVEKRVGAGAFSFAVQRWLKGSGPQAIVIGGFNDPQGLTIPGLANAPLGKRLLVLLRSCSTGTYSVLGPTITPYGSWVARYALDHTEDRVQEVLNLLSLPAPPVPSDAVASLSEAVAISDCVIDATAQQRIKEGGVSLKVNQWLKGDGPSEIFVFRFAENADTAVKKIANELLGKRFLVLLSICNPSYFALAPTLTNSGNLTKASVFLHSKTLADEFRNALGR